MARLVDERGGEGQEAVNAVPTLMTARLTLRPFALADAARVQELAGDQRVAETTLNIPHPYPDGVAEAWIASHAPAAARGHFYSFAITRTSDTTLLGGIALTLAPRHNRAELGYWLGVPYWNQGYMSEAAQRVVAFGLEALGIHRIEATCLPRNPASARVMEHCGMQREGLLHDYICKEGVYEDILIYALVQRASADNVGR